MSKILITGTEGFIGKNLKKKLENNHSITEINEFFFENDNWTDKLVDMLDTENPEIIFHIGACSDTLETRVNYIMKLNFEVTKRLVDWTRNNNKKLIYSSSAANYGENNLYPSNLYGWSKYVAEQYVISNNQIALRYFNVYGPYEDHKGKMASVAYNFFVKNKNNEICKLFPRKPMRDFVYIEDVIFANIFAMKNYDTLNKQYYEVGCGVARTFEDVLNILNIPYDYTDESLIPKGYQYYTCSNKNYWMEGWTPKYQLEDGLKEYLDYLELSM